MRPLSRGFHLARRAARLCGWAAIIAAFTLCTPSRLSAQEPPYFVAYSHAMEEPGNLEITMRNTAANPRFGNAFGSATVEAATGATDGTQHAGNCAGCHTPPNFADFRFHNTGVSQEEYDAANGPGSFAALAIPTLAQRNQNYDAHLPVTQNHPNATESFRHPAVAGSPQFGDLGLWNVYENPDTPNPQANLLLVVCANAQNCWVDMGLPNTIAQFKTPTLRGLEDSAPYFHNGSKLTFADVINFYINSSQLAREGLLRNPPPEFQNMSISPSDVTALVAFLESLTEDYDDT